MKVLITYYDPSKNVNNRSNGGGFKYGVSEVEATLPLRFGFGSYNEPMKILNNGVNVNSVISISEVISK